MAESILDKIGFTINLLVDQLGTALFIPMVYVIVKYKYCKKQKRLYFWTLCTILVIHAFYQSHPIFLNIYLYPMIQTNCTGGELYGSLGFILPMLTDYLNDFTIFFYLLMVVKLLWSGREGRSAYFKRQPIFVSFAVTIFIQVIGTWLITFAYRYIPGFFTNLSGDQMSLVYYGINCLSSFLTTIQFWGIYLTSYEHRMALKKTFPRMFRFFPSKGTEHLFLSNTTKVEPILPINNNKTPAQPAAVVQAVKRDRTTVKF